MTGGPEQGQLGSYCSNPGRVHSGFHQSNDSKDDEQQLNLETFFFFFLKVELAGSWADQILGEKGKGERNRQINKV